MFQPLLVIWALWATEAWKERKAGRAVAMGGDLDQDTIYG